MTSYRTHLVTGAFSFTGRHIAKRLLARNDRVKTLTGSPRDVPDSLRTVEVHPYEFDDPEKLRKSLEGVDTLFNTYWIRFDRGTNTYDNAVRNTRRLFETAKAAGVRRIVHMSIANPHADSNLPYYRGKAVLEHDLMTCGLSYAIVRPTVLFGERPILLNNIAWLLRRLPLFAIAGDGGYRMQPVFVEDLADLAIECGESNDNLITDAAGPEVFTFDELVETIRDRVGSRSKLVHLPKSLVWAAGRVLGLFLRDVLVTREELDGLEQDLLISHQPPRCPTRLTDWILDHGDNLGSSYLSEVGLHYRRS